MPKRRQVNPLQHVVEQGMFDAFTKRIEQHLAEALGAFRDKLYKEMEHYRTGVRDVDARVREAAREAVRETAVEIAKNILPTHLDGLLRDTGFITAVAQRLKDIRV